MKRKQLVLMGLILAIILSGYIIKSWLADGEQIREVSKIQESNLLLAITDNSKTVVLAMMLLRMYIIF